MKQKNIQNIFESFNSLNILIIGDAMIDSYIWGKVTRLSPEAPVPIVTVTKKENRLGGAANVALNIQAMGAKPILCSVIGRDSNGTTFSNLLRRQKLSTEGIIKSKDRLTTIKTRVIGSNHQVVRIDEEIEATISSEERKILLSRINSILNTNKIDAIIFEDYNKGVISEDLINPVVQAACKKNIPVVVDPKKANFLNYKHITLFKPNLKELKEGLKADFIFPDQKELDKTTDVFRKKQGIQNIMVTLSEQGVYINNGKIKKIIPAHERTIADVSGAGDTVISVASLCIALKLSPVFMASLSNLAGGLVCESVGVVSIDKKALLKEALLLNHNLY